MNAPISTSPSRNFGAPTLIALGVTWALALVLSLLLFGLPYLIPDCTLGGKSTPVQCGALTPFFNAALEWYFSLGILLLSLTPFWFIIGIVIAFLEARRAKAPA